MFIIIWKHRWMIWHKNKTGMILYRLQLQCHLCFFVGIVYRFACCILRFLNYSTTGRRCPTFFWLGKPSPTPHGRRIFCV